MKLTKQGAAAEGRRPPVGSMKLAYAGYLFCICCISLMFPIDFLCISKWIAMSPYLEPGAIQLARSAALFSN